MKSVMNFVILLLFFLHASGATLQIPFSTNTSSYDSEPRLITHKAEEYIQTLLKKWNSSGLSVVVVKRDNTTSDGWRHQFGSYGMARGDGSPMSPDTVFSIASNSKLFLAISVGLLVSNRSLAEERGKELKWTTKIHELIPEWGLMDAEMSRGVTLQDMLSHRTGMPRHDTCDSPREGGISEMISKLRYLRPSAEFREKYQYNNFMYETLSYLPQVLLNQSYESYIDTHLFKPLNMTASTFSVAEAESRGTLADGFQWDMQDIARGNNGTLTPTIPYSLRPGKESISAGAGGVLTSARDLTTWISMLLNNGRHPYTNETIVPAEVVEHVALGHSIADGGKPKYPELSPQVYGAGQVRYSYRGHEVIEHNGASLGFRTQVSRFPNDDFGIAVLSNDMEGGYIVQATVSRIADELLGLKELDWNERYEKERNDIIEKATLFTPRPSPPTLPTQSFWSLAKKSFSHPTYGVLRPCLIPETAIPTESSTFSTHKNCADLLQSYPVQRILNATDLSIPTFIIPYKRSWTTHLRLAHFSENLFNVTLIWTNAEVREREGYGDSKLGGDLVVILDQDCKVEWVHGADEGLAFGGNFWGGEGADSILLDGTGKESAEVWFSTD